MKLLWICPYIPFPATFGGSIRIFHLLDAVAKEAEVHLACLAEDEPVPEALAQRCASVRLFPLKHGRRKAQALALLGGQASFEQAYRSDELDAWLAVHGADFDVILCDSTQMAFTPLPEGPAKVLNLHNLESELMARSAASEPATVRGAYRRWDAARLARAERAAYARFDLIAACSERERRILRGQGVPARVVVVPNGVDVAAYEGDDAAPGLESSDALFMGTMHYAPNAEGLRWLHDEVWPLVLQGRPEARFECVGGHPPADLLALDRPGFRVRGFVPEVLPHLRATRLLAVSLLSGSGTRIKVLEAAAAGVPIVTTSVGCEGLGFEHRRHGLVADSPEAFAEAILDVLTVPEEAARRARAAREWVAAKYRWSRIGRALLVELRRLVRTPAGAL